MQQQHANPLLNKTSVSGLLIALGIIYGDIGTSPLYVFKSIIGQREISELLVLGGISCVIWTLTLQTTFKYVFLTLKADNKGEGGIFSLYALLRQYASWIYIPAIVGACCLLADGIITPPISVSSAIEGLGGVEGLHDIFAPGSDFTVTVVITIIILLFVFQRFGTKIVGASFGPIMFVWFVMLLILGMSHIVEYPRVLLSLSPQYAYQFLVHYPNGFWILGAVFLCTTGAEALYSDLGHCGRKNIQATWFFVKFALIANYMGQGAWLLHSGLTHLNNTNPFYALMPNWFLIVGVIIATFATIIASQALISGSFTLISEAISMNFWPKVAIKFPTDIRGQIYIPSVNFMLCVGCISMMLHFRESSEMEAAYGFFIILAMLMTTILMYGYMMFIREWHFFVVAFIMFIFFTVEFAYLAANLAKIKQIWFVIFFQGGMMFVMFVWFRARKITNRYLEFLPLKQFIPAILDLSKDNNVPHYATHLVYLTKANNPANVEKRIIDSVLNTKPKRADVYWFVHVERSPHPYTMEYSVQELFNDKVMRVDFVLGFRVQLKLNVLFKKIMQDLAENNELNIHSKYESLKKHDFHTDITYIILDRFISIENQFSLKDGFILGTYYYLKKMAQTDQANFGLDNADTIVEPVPLIITQIGNIPLKRIESLNKNTIEVTE